MEGFETFLERIRTEEIICSSNVLDSRNTGGVNEYNSQEEYCRDASKDFFLNMYKEIWVKMEVMWN